MPPLRAVGPRLVDLGRRSREVLALSALTGALVGLGVAAFEWVTAQQLLDRLLRAPLPVQAVAPTLGLVAAALALRHLARRSAPSTSDEYIRDFHDPTGRLDLRLVPGRLLASVATLGAGGALGFEGPSIYLGAAVGTAVQGRFRAAFARTGPKVLMVAGAAAGVAAIFKAPATGAIFALEVPYRDDTARHTLLPALVGSASGYLAYVALNGTGALFPVDGSPPFGWRELAGGLALGVVAGLGARAFTALLRAAKRAQHAWPLAARVALGGAVAAGALVLCRLVYGESLSLGAGYNVIEWVGEGGHGIGLVALLLVVRAAVTASSVTGGGAGGLFVPLVVLGALVGQLLGDAVGEATRSLFPVIGVAAFLGAGYRTPLAAVVFVAETTGRPGFIIPGVLATVVSQLMMGDRSVSPYQRPGRRGHLEHRFTLPVSAAVQTDVLSAPPDLTLEELASDHLLVTRKTTVPVVDGADLVGIVQLGQLAAVPRQAWATTTAGALARRDVPAADPSWPLGAAVHAMEAAGTDLLPVTGGDGAFVGVVTMDDIVRLDEILHLAGPGGHGASPGG